MKVHLIKERTIKNYIVSNANSKPAFEDWLSKLKSADWGKPNDIKKTYNTADLLGKSSHRVVFDIGGNNYRMICKCGFGEEEVHVFICWIGTHSEYDELCKKGNQYKVNIY